MNLRGLNLYRRGEPALRVPVVLPQVDVSIDDRGSLDLRLDGDPYTAVGDLDRGDLQRMVAQIATDLDSAIRVNIQEADGSTFADIITPPADDTTPVDPSPVALGGGPGEVCESGFDPGEQVLVVVVVGHQVADETGTALLRLPPALLTAHRDDILLISAPAAAATAKVGAA